MPADLKSTQLRLVLSEGIWSDKDLWQLYGYLLFKADSNGEWKVSLKEVYSDLRMSRQHFRTLLNKLKSTTKLTTKSTTKSTTITLILSERMRVIATTKSTTKLTTKSTTNKAQFTPPTKEEAQEYIDENGFHWGNAALFIDFYEQKGWRLADGKTMTDWRAAMRNWENRWKSKYANGRNKTSDSDKYSARRGTDVGSHEESDYGGSF